MKNAYAGKDNTAAMYDKKKLNFFFLNFQIESEYVTNQQSVQHTA